MAASVVGVALFLASTPLAGQQLRFPTKSIANDSTIGSSIAALAREAAAVYADANRDRYRDNMGRLQVAAGEFAAAGETFGALRAERLKAGEKKSAVAIVPYEFYAIARKTELAERLSLPDAFRQSFRDIAPTMDDRTAAYELTWSLGTYLPRLEENLREALGRRKGTDVVSMADAIDLIRRYVAVDVYKSILPLVGSVLAEDDRRRYFVDENLLIGTPDGARICVLVMRPRTGAARLPALLNFSIYADTNHTDEARLSASHGYVGVSALSRGKGCSPDNPMPFEHDGADATSVIDWIARQPWSDGRVGMFGGSYDGFAQWAALKHHPSALKAIMPSVTADPGLGFPMEGGVFMNYSYPYPFYVTNVKGLDANTYYDSQRWNRLNREWYIGGRAYAALDSIDGTPNPIFDKWLAHPAYDEYWQAMSPYGKEFATITIPVLTTTGYYDSGQEGALYYFTEHYKHNSAANHYLVIGPYDHVRGQRGTISPLGARLTSLRGYTLDSVAQIEIPGLLRYEWFDYVFKGGTKPVLLEDRVNYQVMGANVWKHASSVDAMGPEKLRLYLSAERSGTGYRMTPRQPSVSAAVTHAVNLADRSDVDQPIVDQALDGWNIIDDSPHIGNAISFATDPFAAPIEVSGRFSGRLDFITNKKDFDVSVTLFELTPKGQYFQLSYCWLRASYGKDRSHRHLLTPGKKEQLTFESGRLTSRQFEPGSRLVVVLGVIKQPGEQINYGTGRDVSQERIADAKEPLHIEWLNQSFVTVPVGR
ncbi:MAG TPA: CocE/NonD family hydrolase [Gemmatimonadaceae bacterium]|jgi:putative CocE/NonD family hydrolase|nr:CocE/NonD family hydrolase [Gemmatimonadaceae bacterium]